MTTPRFWGIVPSGRQDHSAALVAHVGAEYRQMGPLWAARRVTTSREVQKRLDARIAVHRTEIRLTLARIRGWDAAKEVLHTHLSLRRQAGKTASQIAQVANHVRAAAAQAECEAWDNWRRTLSSERSGDLSVWIWECQVALKRWEQASRHHSIVEELEGRQLEEYLARMKKEPTT